MVFLIKNAVFPGVPLALNQRSHFSTMVRGTPLFFFFFSGPQCPAKLALQILSLSPLVLRSQKQRVTQKPVNLTSVPEGSQSVREALDRTRLRGPSSSQSTNYYRLSWHRGDD